jgi:pimeloyl-ACP methyl ester carboxylesterase
MAGAMVFVGFRVSHPSEAGEAATPAHYLLAASEIPWVSRDGQSLAGYWIPGRRGGPAVVLATGYGMSRSDGLSLATVLHHAGFNVLLYSQRGCGAKPRGASWLGLRETTDMETALDLLAQRTDIDRTQIGVWGVDVGARAALAAAAGRPAVRVIVADCPYQEVRDFLSVRLKEDLGISSPILHRIAGWGLGFVASRAVREASALSVDRLGDRDVMVVCGDNRPDLTPLAVALHSRIRPAKTLITLQASRIRLMAGEELAKYDAVVAGFFQLYLGKQYAGGKPGKQN